jgi:hypothetical protein
MRFNRSSSSLPVIGLSFLGDYLEVAIEIWNVHSFSASNWRKLLWKYRQGSVAHTCNPSNSGAEIEGTEIQDQPRQKISKTPSQTIRWAVAQTYHPRYMGGLRGPWSEASPGQKNQWTLSKK